MKYDTLTPAFATVFFLFSCSYGNEILPNCFDLADQNLGYGGKGRCEATGFILDQNAGSFLVETFPGGRLIGISDIDILEEFDLLTLNGSPRRLVGNYTVKGDGVIIMNEVDVFDDAIQ